MESQVARLRQQIELECEAIRLAMFGYAMVSSHEVINRKYKALDEYRNQLADHVGEEAATSIIVETYNQKIH